MMTTRENTTEIALNATINALSILLSSAAVAAKDAEDAIAKGERNLAIGALMTVESAIQSIGPLYATILSLHRNQ